MEYQSENKICQNCKKDFIIEPDDFNFYEKIKVPAPTWCPECRLIRRLAYRENRPLYKDKCNFCDKDIVSIFSNKTSLKVSCSECWWGDGWDAIDYGRDYDFTKPFFSQIRELQQVVPREATGQKNSQNCKYSNGNIRCKDCILTFDGYESINCYNCETPAFSRDSMDSSIIMNADHAYESVNSNGIYNTKFVYFSDECLDSSFLFNCIGCIKCFGCINLRNKKYHIFNKPYSKKDYEKEMLKWDLGDYNIIQKAKKLFTEEYYKTPKRFALITNSSDVLGDDIKNTKNCQNCFATRNGVENCKYIFTAGLLLKDSYDVIFGGDKSEIFYETSGGVGSQRCFFTRAANSSKDLEYCNRVFNCSNLFGCVHLKNKKYCILNKQYTKEKYFEMVEKIKKHMNEMPYIDRKGRVYKYGEFFPTELSLWAYNETWAHKYFPLTKEEVLEKGYNWEDKKERNYKITIKAQDLTNHINNVNDSILDEVIGCEHLGTDCNHQCMEAFRILPNELQFYKQMQLALPRCCPNCRDYEKQKFMNKPILNQRRCMCNGTHSINNVYKNLVPHIHNEEPCKNEFKTAIAQGGQEIVYCKECYQSEFI